MGNPIPSRDAREGIVSVIIDAYHTTRMAETPAWMHILSKPFVKSAFARFEAQIRADAYEQAAKACNKIAIDCLATQDFEEELVGRGAEACADAIRALPEPDSTNEGLAELLREAQIIIDGWVRLGAATGRPIANAVSTLARIDTALSTGRQA